MPTRSAPIARRSGDAERAGGRRRSGLAAGSAEADIRSPFAGGGDAADGADHRAAGDDEPEVVPDRRDQLLDQRSGRWNQGLMRDLLQTVGGALPSVSHRKMSTPQLPWRGLMTQRRLDVGKVTARAVRCSVRG